LMDKAIIWARRGFGVALLTLGFVFAGSPSALAAPPSTCSKGAGAAAYNKGFNTGYNKGVNEGLNLQSVIDTIIWAELAMNLFFFIQASQRAWRLGKEELVKILIPYYLGSATHRQVRRLGERDGAAAAFAGEPAKGGLVQHVGADQTTLARLSAQIEAGELSELDLLLQAKDDSAEIEANFVRRNQELAEALRRGRQWFGVVDRLSEPLLEDASGFHQLVTGPLPGQSVEDRMGDSMRADRDERVPGQLDDLIPAHESLLGSASHALGADALRQSFA